MFYRFWVISNVRTWALKKNEDWQWLLHKLRISTIARSIKENTMNMLTNYKMYYKGNLKTLNKVKIGLVLLLWKDSKSVPHECYAVSNVHNLLNESWRHPSIQCSLFANDIAHPFFLEFVLPFKTFKMLSTYHNWKSIPSFKFVKLKTVALHFCKTIPWVNVSSNITTNRQIIFLWNIGFVF